MMQRTFALLIITVILALGQRSDATTDAIREFAIPTANSWPSSIVAGKDGAMWFTEFRGHAIGRIKLNGAITEFQLPTERLPYQIVSGPDGALWFTELDRPFVGRIATSGKISEVALPVSAQPPPPYGARAYPGGSCGIASAGGYLWVTGIRDPNSPALGDGGFSNGIARLSPDGKATVFRIPHRAGPCIIRAGIDNTVWFTEPFHNAIGVLTMDGHLTEYAMAPKATQPQGIAQHRDGAVWYTQGNWGLGGYSDKDPGSIFRMRKDGSLSEYPLPAAPGAPAEIISGMHDQMWFTELGGNSISSIDDAGKITEFKLPEMIFAPYTGPPPAPGVSYPKTGSTGPSGITIGPDNAIWATETYNSAIVRFAPP
jgi:virginiamycin B lyase